LSQGDIRLAVAHRLGQLIAVLHVIDGKLLDSARRAHNVNTRIADVRSYQHIVDDQHSRQCRGHIITSPLDFIREGAAGGEDRGFEPLRGWKIGQSTPIIEPHNLLNRLSARNITVTIAADAVGNKVQPAQPRDESGRYRAIILPTPPIVLIMASPATIIGKSRDIETPSRFGCSCRHVSFFPVAHHGKTFDRGRGKGRSMRGTSMWGASLRGTSSSGDRTPRITNAPGLTTLPAGGSELTTAYAGYRSKSGPRIDRL
jgi:hypothetical protein